ncbi:MAG: cache domain-containing protein, partial [Acidiferrobacteraceae bacterium]|nr:cache domain-containing protein [Acidiferrobacteraceae bacterium]
MRTKPTVQNPRNRALIESAVLLLVIALTVILIGVGQYFLDLKRFREDQRQQERLVVDQARLVIQGALASAVSDIRILAQIVERVGVPASLGDSRAGTLAEYFSTLARERPMYDQIRLLNYPGREIVRINLSPEGLEVVERQDLQDKSKRYYFTQARDLEAGQIYISPVDVNVEWGESEAVPRPMFRVATPVFDDGGHPRGVVLINYRGEALAEIFRAGMGAAGDRLTVLDQRGYWLSNPRQELEWGFAYDSDARFQNHYPTIWRQMAQQVSGTHLNRRGMFTFTRLNSL